MRLSLLFLLCLLSLGSQAQNSSAHNFEVAKQLDIFNSLYRELDLYYVDTLQAQKNIENALLYMLDQLDPYTQYFPESETHELKEMTTGKYAGIGSPIIYSERVDRCVFSEPYEGMPAAQAGLRTGDIILAVDGKELGGRGERTAADYSADVSSRLRGEAGTTFELRVRRPGSDKPLTFRLQRRVIERPSVSYATLTDDSIAYVALSGYTENTARDLRRSLVELKRDGARRLILDLRGNPGGLMQEAIDIVGFFIPRGKEVVATKGKIREFEKSYKTSSEPFDTEMPICVLVDYSTASSAEITSGALQDYDRAVIVGRRTYGKGLVQMPRDLPYKAMLKLTTSKYYIPSGRCVQAYDFKNRGNDGQPLHLPDSLCHTFYTSGGRPVRDGGGITPDVVVVPDTLTDFVEALIRSDEVFDYIVDYRNSHAEIAAPLDFCLTDEEYAAFSERILRSKFKYESQSRRYLSALRSLAAAEGYGSLATAEFDALAKKLDSNTANDLERYETDIRRLLEGNIVGSYYYESGSIEYSLRDDSDFITAVEILRNDARYRQILAGTPSP